MKIITGLIAIILILFAIKINNKADKLLKIQTDTRLELDTMRIMIDNHFHRDSVLKAHFSECAFVSNSDVGIGYQGYFYDKNYRRNYAGN
jgi:hypothetical protein